MKDLISDIVKAMVGQPDQVSINEIESDHTVVLELRVAKRDLGTRDGSFLTYHYIVDVKESEFPEGHWQRVMNERATSACDNENKKIF